jgi:protein-S-isoprenylcysteine O-methyltransferase Ste14
MSTPSFLEARIPPPLVGVAAGALMWGLSRLGPVLDVSLAVRASVAVALTLLGGAISIAGVVSFARAKTTVNPLKPETASALVASGIYRWTRNPMYLGLLTVLLGWAAFLASPWGVLGPVIFVLYLNRFQIAPEERALERLFGASFVAYKSKVRRWL